MEIFIWLFGYTDKFGRADRLNFGGVHLVSKWHKCTGMKFVLNRYDHSRAKVTDDDGALHLVEDKDTVAASWSFSDLLHFWKKKHAQAVYVPGELRKTPQREYRYGPVVRQGEGTSFNHLVGALARGDIY